MGNFLKRGKRQSNKKQQKTLLNFIKRLSNNMDGVHNFSSEEYIKMADAFVKLGLLEDVE